MLHSRVMPNFPPLRRYVFSVVDRWAARHGLGSPFLEVGCGTGTLSAHLAARGWTGVALDSSPEALARAKTLLAPFPGVAVHDGVLETVEGRVFRTAFVMDVIEHVRDDVGLLRALAERLEPGGWLVLLVPVNPAEWRRDDVLYGHYRRYAWDEVQAKLREAGFEPTARWNVTVPWFWAMRRLYLAVLPARPDGRGQDQLTAASSIYNPWDWHGPLRWAGKFLGLGLWWWLPFRILDLFANSRRGHAAMFLARKR
ncbi:MAG: class I SAM-dependent methyltransferase [Candidatus Coatesbacteria bacterium]